MAYCICGRSCTYVEDTCIVSGRKRSKAWGEHTRHFLAPLCLLTAVQVLEVISSSQSLVSTVRGLYALRIWTAWSAVLLILWAWSPLGGQAILRSMQLNDNTTSLYHQAVSYPINNLSSWSLDPFNSGVSGGGSIYNQFRAVLDAVFCSPDVALMHSNGTSIDFDDAVERAGGATQANKIAQMDIWHNVRVPFVHLLPEYDSDSPFSWTNVPADSVAPYSSLLGVPIRGVPAAKQGNSTMLIQTNYQTLSVNLCSVSCCKVLTNGAIVLDLV